MKFDDFVKLIPKIQNMPLPGKEAHYKMSSEERIMKIVNQKLNTNKARKAAVLPFFYPDATNEVTMLLTLRKTYRGVHSNQISFPGGKVEDDDITLEDTALRETEEEVGLVRDKVTLVRPLSKVFIPPSNFLVQPYFGLVTETPSFIIDPKEVEQEVSVSLEEILDDYNLCTVKRKTFYADETNVPAFNFRNYIVWGATAMILNEVKELLKEAI